MPSEAELKATFLHKVLLLRDFNGDAEIHWSWDGTRWVQAPPRIHELSGIQVERVKFKGGRLHLEGKRADLMKVNGTGELRMVDDGVRVSIDAELPPSATTGELTQLEQAMFFATVQEALDTLPQIYRHLFPMPINVEPAPKQTAPARALKSCDCADSNCRDLFNATTYTHPVLLHSIDPDLPEIPDNMKVDGEMGLEVDDTGRPRNVWVLRPDGGSFDEVWSKTVLQYRFHPAVCHGRPVAEHITLNTVVETD